MISVPGSPKIREAKKITGLPPGVIRIFLGRTIVPYFLKIYSETASLKINNPFDGVYP